MLVTHLTLDTLAAWLHGLPPGPPGEWHGEGAVVILDLALDLDLDGSSGPAPVLHAGLAAVVVGTTRAPSSEAPPAASACDVLVHPDDPVLSSIAAAVEEHPIAATTLAGLLRGSEQRTLDDGLLVESAAYSSLQSGPEFAKWRGTRPSRQRAASGPAVLVERVGAMLRITLNRPDVRNALDTAMRDQLVEAFRLPAVDPSITEVHLAGAGAAFCAGGDLDEFGSFSDAASAHVVRLQQSVGRAIAAVADRVTAHLHGACAGSGIELSAFAHRVVADPATRISLPEVSLGLIPGAGGTVSLPRRIGRHRTARLALSGESIDATTALAWGLIDAIEGTTTARR